MGHVRGDQPDFDHHFWQNEFVVEEVSTLCDWPAGNADTAADIAFIDASAVGDARRLRSQSNLLAMLFAVSDFLRFDCLALGIKRRCARCEHR